MNETIWAMIPLFHEVLHQYPIGAPERKAVLSFLIDCERLWGHG